MEQPLDVDALLAAPAPAAKALPPAARKVSRERLLRLAARWKKAKGEDRAELGTALEALCKGDPFADPGERDETLYRVLSDLAREVPDADPNGLAALFAVSLDATGDDPEHDRAKVIEKFTRAREALAESWYSRLAVGKDGSPTSSLANTITILSYHEALVGRLAYDERRLRPVWIAEPPWDAAWSGGAGRGAVPRDVDEYDAGRMATWLSTSQRLTVSGAVVAEAIAVAAQQIRFDRVREYLAGLEWDGVPRLDMWLSTYCGAEDTPYVRRVGAAWMISAVARTVSPGCKVDTMLILEGLQGVLKSTVFYVLAGRGAFTDHLPEIGTKDCSQAVHGPWIIEMAELDAFDRKEASTIKSFLTIRHDRFRPPYGRATAEFERRCVFAGTTNKEHYLHDETGARRFWPVKVGRCAVEALERDRDQLWAEAVYRMVGGETWWLEFEDECLAITEQAKRYDEDVLSATILNALDDGVKGQAPDLTIPPMVEFITVGQILECVINLTHGQWSQQMANRVSGILSAAGWARCARGTGGKTLRGFLRPLDRS